MTRGRRRPAREIFVLTRFSLPSDPNKDLQYAQRLQVWRDGKYREVRLPPGTADRHILQTKPKLVVVTRKRELRRLVDGDTWEPIAIDVAPTDEVHSLRSAPDGSMWLGVEPGHRVLRRDPAGTTREATPPSEPEKPGAVRTGYWTPSDTRIVGIEQGDPWALSPTGTLSHWVDDDWRVVSMGRLFVNGIALPAKGDIYVVGAFEEKVPGSSKPAVHVQVLRTKPPKEVVRCTGGPRRGFTSTAIPIAK